MRVLLLYPPPWKIPVRGEAPAPAPEGPPNAESPYDLPDNDGLMIPYGLLTLAGIARRAGHQVEVYNFGSFAWREVERFVAANPAEVFGLSCFTHNRHGVMSLARRLKEAWPRAHVTVGGPFASALPRELLRYCPAIDSVVVGEGEVTFAELLERLARGETAAGLAGAAWRQATGIEQGPAREPLADLDQVPAPSELAPQLPILITSRGCPGRCTYCGSPALWGKKVRFHSAEYVLDCLTRIVREAGLRCLGVKDDTFTADRKRVLEICRGIHERDLNFIWSCDTRVDMVDEERLTAMRRAGCQRISFGVESFDPAVLQAIGKRTTPEQIRAATELARSLGFRIRYYLMAGNRGETAANLRAGFETAARARPNETTLCLLTINPGTADFELAHERGIVNAEFYFTQGFCSFRAGLGENTPAYHQLLLELAPQQRIYSVWQYGLAECAELVRKFPDLGAAYVDLAEAYYHSGRLAEAETALRRAEELNYPLPAVILNFQGCIAAQRGQADLMLEKIRQAAAYGQSAQAARNWEAIRKWSAAGGVNSGQPLELTANHDFDLLCNQVQPIVPAPL